MIDDPGSLEMGIKKGPIVRNLNHDFRGVIANVVISFFARKFSEKING